LPNADTHGEAATRNASPGNQPLPRLGMYEDLNSAVSINLRASLVPAAAVIPAQGAYPDVVAVKKLVVDSLDKGCPPQGSFGCRISVSIVQWQRSGWHASSTKRVSTETVSWIRMIFVLLKMKSAA